MTDRHQAPAYPLRLPADLKAAVTNAARESGRSFNAEVTARLRDSFGAQQYPHAIQQAVDDMVEETGCTPAEALERLVLAGQSQGRVVLSVRIAPNTSMAQVKAMFEEASRHLPPDANIVMERESATPPPSPKA